MSNGTGLPVFLHQFLVTDFTCRVSNSYASLKIWRYWKKLAKINIKALMFLKQIIVFYCSFKKYLSFCVFLVIYCSFQKCIVKIQLYFRPASVWLLLAVCCCGWMTMTAGMPISAKVKWILYSKTIKRFKYHRLNTS